MNVQALVGEEGLSEEHSPDVNENHGDDASNNEEPGLNKDQRRLESLKLQFEWHKHFSTLTSAITVLIVTVSYTVFRDAASDPCPLATTWFGVNKLLLISFALFFSGLLWSIIARRRVIFLVSTQGVLPTGLYVHLRYLYPLISLCGGLLAFVVFTTISN